MRKHTIVTAVAIAVVSGAIAFTASPEPAQAQASISADAAFISANPWVREPVLIYDVSGSTFAGPFHKRVSVYNDGLATFSTVTLFPAENRAEFTSVSEQAVKALIDGLASAGASSLPDHPGFATDSPLSTVTFFRKPAPRSIANTFSWWFPDGNYSTIAQIINDFIDDNFNNS